MMINVDKLRKEIRKKMSEDRYIHTINVDLVAIEYAERLKVDSTKVSIAALLHDITKEWSRKRHLDLLKKHGVKDIKFYIRHPWLIHGATGALVAEHEYGVKDKDILNAIKYHTNGRKKMSLIEKIIYCADATELTRSYKGADKFRKELKKDFEKGVLSIMKSKCELAKKETKRLNKYIEAVKDGQKKALKK